MTIQKQLKGIINSIVPLLESENDVVLKWNKRDQQLKVYAHKVRKVDAMRTVVNVVYQYDELSEQAKEKAVELVGSSYDINDERNEMLYNDMLEMLKGIPAFDELRYSLSSCQGDGVQVRFDGMGLSDFLDIKLFGMWCDVALEEANRKLDFEAINKLLKFDDFDVQFVGYSERYCHSAGVIVESDVYDHYTEEEIEMDLVENALGSIESWYQTLVGEIERLGYEYLYNISKVDVVDYIECNDIEFNEDGTLFNF